MTELFGADTFVDFAELWRFASKLAVNLTFAFLVIQVVYGRLYHNREFMFTYYLFNVITFSLCLLLRKVPIELGFALGLFAIFGILRYRTEPIRMRDLTYLFVVIGIGLLNALTGERISVVELLAVNAVIVALTALLELWPKERIQRSPPILYDRLDLLKSADSRDLHRDLSARTGLCVIDIEVQRFDLLRDAAELVVYYRDGRRR